MALTKFKLWFEDTQAKLNSSKDTLVTYFKDKLGLDEDAILNTELKDIQPAHVDGLLKLGEIITSNPDIIQRIKNRSGTVQDLANLLAGQAAQPGF
jgi:hypothetical protein